MGLDPDRRSNLCSEPAHQCAATCITEISLIETLSAKKWTWTQNWHLWQKLDLNNIEFVENAQNEESAIYFKGNKFGEDVSIKKKQAWQVCTGVEEGGSGRGAGGGGGGGAPKVGKGT